MGLRGSVHFPSILSPLLFTLVFVAQLLCPAPCDPTGSSAPALQAMWSSSQLHGCTSFAGHVILLAAPWLQHSSGCEQHVNGWANCNPTELHLQNKQQDRFSAQAIIRPPLFLSLFKIMSTESLILSNHLILCRPLILFVFSLSQHQGLFQWVGSSHQVAKVLELQPWH